MLSVWTAFYICSDEVLCMYGTRANKTGKLNELLEFGTCAESSRATVTIDDTDVLLCRKALLARRIYTCTTMEPLGKKRGSEACRVLLRQEVLVPLQSAAVLAYPATS